MTTSTRRLPFAREEFVQRREKITAEMDKLRLEALLLFAPESAYWLTGLDLQPRGRLQCLILRRGGAPCLLAPQENVPPALRASLIEDIRGWRAPNDPAVALREILTEFDLKGAQIGVEMETPHLCAGDWRRLTRRIAGWAEICDASNIVSDAQLIKSPAEIDRLIEAGRIGARAYRAACSHLAPGARPENIAAILDAEARALGGSPTAAPAVVSHHGPREILTEGDQLTFYWASAKARYHACTAQTVMVADLRPEQTRLHEIASKAFLACEKALTPGVRFEEIYEIYLSALENAAYTHARMDDCGFALNPAFAPTIGAGRSFRAGETTKIRSSMALFLHVAVQDPDSGVRTSLGRSYIAREAQPEPLPGPPLGLWEG